MAFEMERLVAIRAVRAACKATQFVRNGAAAQAVDAISKEDFSPVTAADYAAQITVNRILRSSFPHACMVSEEDSKQLRQDDGKNQLVRAKLLDVLRHFDASVSEAEMLDALDFGKPKTREEPLPSQFWTLDPVDGTKGFLRNDQYAVALGLIDGGEVVLGVLGCPWLPDRWEDPASPRGSLFVAVRGGGCHMLSLDDEAAPAVPVRVAGTSDVKQAVVLESVEAAHTAHGVSADIRARLGIEAPARRMDSQAKYGALSRGDGTIMLRLPKPGAKRYEETIWDHAAGKLVVEEAGGKVTDVHGKPLDFTRGTTLAANSGVIASNGIMHAQILEAVAAAMAAAGQH
eukprot:m.230230 g.230230  ORF g.230230 m.230230 type:complete len:345 (-) comp17957_c0_seq1:53-1087(-)